jgi:hypothetical protein
MMIDDAQPPEAGDPRLSRVERIRALMTTRGGRGGQRLHDVAIEPDPDYEPRHADRSRPTGGD